MMAKRRLLLFLAALPVWANLNSTSATSTSPVPTPVSPFPSTSSPPPTRTSPPSGVIIDEAGARRTSSVGQLPQKTEAREKTRGREPPGSPVNLFMPDEFQFYTLNANGQLVMKQMTKQEIQGMIAAGGGNAGLPVDLSHHHHQNKLPDGEPKVSDVVENVQKVLKNELNKPIQVPVSESSIPGSVNSQWTNMLPYILSGGSVDQQDIAQDTSIILPTLDADQSYIDVVPLHDDKPSDDEMNYIPLHSTVSEEEIKLITHEPTLGFTNGKPISLLGNMALDTGILGNQETHSPPTKSKPSSTTPTYHKYTTTKSPFTSNLKDTTVNMKNSSSNKPTLYIPLSVSSSLLTDAQNEDNYSSQHNFKTTQQEKSTNPPKKSTTYAISDETGFTRVPMIQVPVISADKIISSTQRTNQQQTPMFEILPTISPGSITSTTIKEESYTSKMNIGPMGGFKKPETNYKPPISFRPHYEPSTKSSTVNILSTPSYHPVYEATVKPSSANPASPTYRPVYEPITKSSTSKTITSTYHPEYKPVTKISTATDTPLSYESLNYEGKTKPSTTIFKSTSSSHSIYEISTKPSEGLKLTQPSSTIYSQTTGKSSVSDISTRSSTPSGVKVTKHPSNVHQTYTEDSSIVTEVVTKPSVQSGVLEVTKFPESVQKTTIKNKENDPSLVYIVQQEPSVEKYHEVPLTSENKENNEIDLSKILDKEKNNDNNYLLLNSTTEIDKSEYSTVSSNVDNYDRNTIRYPDPIIKIQEKTNLYDTTLSDKMEVESETATAFYYNTEKSTQPLGIDIDTSDEQLPLKTESYTLYDDLSVRPTIQSQESNTGIYNYTAFVQETTKEPDTIIKQTDNISNDVTETIIPNYETSSIKSYNDNKYEKLGENIKFVQLVHKDPGDTSFIQKESNQSSAINGTQIQLFSESETTAQFIPLDGSVTEYYTNIDNLNAQKEPVTTAYEELEINKEKTTIIPVKYSTDKIEDSDSTNIYSTINDLIIDEYESPKPSANGKLQNPIQENYKLGNLKPENSILESDYTEQPNFKDVLNKNSVPTIISTVKENDKLAVTTNNYVNNFMNEKLTTEYYVSTNNEKPISEESSVSQLQKVKITDATDNYESIKLITENPDKLTMQYYTEADATPAYEKMETVTENNFSIKDKIDDITSTDINNQKEKVDIPFISEKIKIDYNNNEEEISTVKVIPVYDDDTAMYTLLSENTGKTTIIPISKKPYNKTAQFIESMKHQENEQLATLSTLNYTTESTFLPNTDLPGLQETFNNYMKEHYDSKLSTTDNYDEISHFTTFSTLNDNDLSSQRKKLPSSPSTILEYVTTNRPQYKKGNQKIQFNTDTTMKSQDQNIKLFNVLSSTPMTVENIKKSEPEETGSTTQNNTIKNTLAVENLEYRTTKNPAINNTSVETPIIFLELTSPKPDEQNASYQTTNDLLTNSSFTRIKIKNPVSEINKIISEVPIINYTLSTQSYTLPSFNQTPNNIASGIIAGYPTYNQEQPITDYMSSTISYQNTDKGSNSSTINKPVQLKTEELEKKDTEKSNIENQKKPLESIPVKEEKVAEKTSSKLPYVETEKPSVSNYSATLNNESYIQIPSESTPLTTISEIPSQTAENDDQFNSSFIPPLEKISDLINQLKNSPSDENSIATTIVPLDNFETILNESSINIKNNTTPTLLENSSNNSELQNSTYIMIPTLPYNSTTNEPDKVSTKPYTYKTSTTTLNLKETTTINSLKNKSSSGVTTESTTLKQTVTEKPYLTSTLKTTKGPIEKVQSTIDKSAGRINLEEEKIKLQQIKPTEPVKYTMKNKFHYSSRRPVNEAHQSFTRKATKPVTKLSTTVSIERTTIKATTEIPKESSTEKWTLISQKNISEQAVDVKSNSSINMTTLKEGIQPQPNAQIVPLDHSSGAIGLDQSNKGLDKDVAEFINMCNELSFQFWTLANTGLTSSRSLTISPFGMISTLAMIFLGARGTTSIQMNDVLRLDDVVTFNPHLVFQNITDTVTLARGQGIENAAFVRALFTDRLKVRRIMPFYKEQAQQFYEGAVVDINFSTAGDILRRRTNLLIRKQTGGRIKDFVKSYTVPLRSPLTALSANVFQTSCDGPDASSEGRDGEMYFALAQTVKQRKLVPIPAVVWKSGVSAGYEPSLDATAIALGDPKRPVSLIMIMPGQQGVTAPGDNLDRLENRLFGNPSGDALEKLLKVVIPRRVELQMPKFSHRSILNVTSALKRMGFEPLFTKQADLKGINGAGHDLYLADMIQMNLFCTCGDENKLGNRHLSETYPGTASRHTRTWEIINNSSNSSGGVSIDSLESRDVDNNSESRESRCEDGEPEDGSDSSNSNGAEDEPEQQQQQQSAGKWDLDRMNNLRQKIDKKRLRWFMPTGRRRCRNRRQAEPEKPRMKIDKPFLYLVRHNLTGLILHIGRFNPKSQS